MMKTLITRVGLRCATAVAAAVCISTVACSTATRAGAPNAAPNDGMAVDARVGLAAGWKDAGQAAWNLELVAHRARPEGFFSPSEPGSFAYANSDLAFQGDYLFQGNYNGFMIWDISDPTNPTLRTAFVCPGGQGDLSVYGDLLFMSVQERRARIDCGTQGVEGAVSDERIKGIRIFDISDLDNPQQIAVVQTCRGSHTHTLVTDPDDPDNVYIYVQGTSRVRPLAELEGCRQAGPNTARFRIEVIRVPLDSPEDARVVNRPRIFADAQTGDISGLWMGGDHGPGTQETATTDQCHDITAYPAIGRAAGACSGNGILLDITDPANPRRLDAVSDPNFAYWHSATFTNDGSAVLFTDEWGGGVAPRCQAETPEKWGADAIFTVDNGSLGETPVGYYKLPAPQTATENCVAHNGSLIPVPGRDIMVQGWYQGGLSVFDFTDPSNPVEIAYFDRGPLDADDLMLGGYWSVYWYNGYIYGSGIARGLDVFELTPSPYLSAEEIRAAESVELERFNPQTQPKITWANSAEE